MQVTEETNVAVRHLRNGLDRMNTLPIGARLVLKNLLFLSDFSDASELAIPYAINLAREYGARLQALHVLTPGSIVAGDPETADAAMDGFEEGTQSEIQRLEVR